MLYATFCSRRHGKFAERKRLMLLPATGSLVQRACCVKLSGATVVIYSMYIFILLVLSRDMSVTEPDTWMRLRIFPFPLTQEVMNRLAVGRSARAQQAHKVNNRINWLMPLHKTDTDTQLDQ